MGSIGRKYRESVRCPLPECSRFCQPGRGTTPYSIKSGGTTVTHRRSIRIRGAASYSSRFSMSITSLTSKTRRTPNTIFFDPLKRIHIGDNWLFTTGGEFRTRYENAYNDRFTQTNNIYQLTRTRVYTDLWYRDNFRLFVEYIGAWSAFQDLPPLPTDQQKSGIQNLFVDIKLADLGGEPAYVRVGRQELLFGSQRLISTVDWVNTPGHSGRARVPPNRSGTSICFGCNRSFRIRTAPFCCRTPTSSTSVDNNQNFVGAWTTYRLEERAGRRSLLLDARRHQQLCSVRHPEGSALHCTPLAADIFGNKGNFLFDSESAIQFGSQNGRDALAGMTTQGIGWNFKDAPWNPTIWAYYDFASGGNPITGTAHTFNQLFAFGHTYLGWIDLIGRQNIQDLNFHLYLYPAKWLTTWVQYHNFWLANKTDALYQTGGNVVRFDLTGRAGAYVGQELDLVLNFHLSKHADILTGYSHLWGGEFLKNTANAINAANGSLYYLQFSYKW